jgi:hypothetical protein
MAAMADLLDPEAGTRRTLRADPRAGRCPSGRPHPSQWEGSLRHRRYQDHDRGHHQGADRRLGQAPAIRHWARSRGQRSPIMSPATRSWPAGRSTAGAWKPTASPRSLPEHPATVAARCEGRPMVGLSCRPGSVTDDRSDASRQVRRYIRQDWPGMHAGSVGRAALSRVGLTSLTLSPGTGTIGRSTYCLQRSGRAGRSSRGARPRSPGVA